MENAQLIGLSRQIALQRQMDVVANNIANINTTGFKSEQLLFEEYLMPVARDRDFRVPDQRLSFTQDWSTVHDMSAGAITQTGNPLDVALQGDGFLVVETPAGQRWTKAGSLQIDATGTLVNLDGHPVLSDAGPVRFAAAETDVTIAQDGTISSSAGLKGRLRLVEFADPQETVREGDNLFSGGTPLAGHRNAGAAGRHREIQRLGRRRDDRDDPGAALLPEHRQPDFAARRNPPFRDPAARQPERLTGEIG